MGSEIFEELEPTKLLLGLNGVWLTAPASALASATLALVLAKAAKLDALYVGYAERLPV